MDPRFQASKPKEPKVSIWDKIANQSMKTLSDRIKFLFTFLLIGFVFIAAGDVLKHFTFGAIGLALIIVGWIVIGIGPISVLFHYLETN
jgi:energy-coupling factor transporter transmembrane protein EcfT